MKYVLLFAGRICRPNGEYLQDTDWFCGSIPKRPDWRAEVKAHYGSAEDGGFSRRPKFCSPMGRKRPV